MFTAEAPLIQNLLVILGVIGIFFGSLGALRTYDAKRLLAYSTFGQIGFILVGIGWGPGRDRLGDSARSGGGIGLCRQSFVHQVRPSDDYRRDFQPHHW